MCDTKRPNILLILADQHRFDCIGAYGNTQIKTPNLDKLALDGVLYRNSFCPFPICTPSRYSLIAGLYPHQHTGRDNNCTLPPAIATFPRILKEAGYATKAIGKMHFRPTYLDVGFEEMLLAEQNGPGRYDDDYHRYLKESGLADKVDLWDQEREYRALAPAEYHDSLGAMTSDLDEEHHSTTWIGERAVETIEKWSEGGNMLMVGFIKPHHPFDPPEPWSRMYDSNAVELLPGWTEKCIPHDIERNRGGLRGHESISVKQMKKVTAYYYAAISQIDYQIGRMIGLLKRKGVYDSTLIIYTSDHGEYLGFHHMILKSNHMYDPLVKVPLIIKYPCQNRRGEIDNGLVNNPDVTATIIKQAGCEQGDFMMGEDLSNGTPDRDYVFSEDQRGYMIRSKTRKLLVSADAEKSLFFDLEKDPYELNNLFDSTDYKAEVEAYKGVLADWILFRSKPPVYRDEYAPRISGSNVPGPDDDQCEKMKAYFKNKMTEGKVG